MYLSNYNQCICNYKLNKRIKGRPVNLENKGGMVLNNNTNLVGSLNITNLKNSNIIKNSSKNVCTKILEIKQ